MGEARRKKESAALKAQVLADLLPGEKVHIKTFGVDAKVFPLGVTHLKRFSTDIVGILHALMRANINPGEDSKVQVGALARHAIPLVLQSGLALLDECVVLKVPSGKDGVADIQLSIDDLPHWEVPPLIQSWILQSFDTKEKRDPWVEAVNRVVRQVTNDETFSILETASKLSSPADTPSKTS